MNKNRFLLQKVVIYAGGYRYFANAFITNASFAFVNLITNKMLAPTSYQSAAVPFKTSTDQIVRPTTNRKLLPTISGISYQNLITKVPSVKKDNPLYKPAEAVITQNALSSSKIFTITFSYLQKLCYTKVLKVIYRADDSIYKVVLRSQVSPGTMICWLQFRAGRWSLLLGHGLDEKLISAITSAIVSQE